MLLTNPSLKKSHNYKSLPLKKNFLPWQTIETRTPHSEGSQVYKNAKVLYPQVQARKPVQTKKSSIIMFIRGLYAMLE